jgi:L-threonylcarbamoyladenylate synthase
MASSTGQRTRIVAADAAGVAKAVRLLAAGDIVVLPTETVYGLAADAANAAAVARVFAAKGRPAINPLISHVADLAMAERYGAFGEAAQRLAARFWPGPLTLVVPRREGAPLAPAVTAGLPTVALRVPAHPVAQAVIAGLGRAVAAPSANVSGRLSPTRAQHVQGLEADLLLDAGPCAAGLESSIVKVGPDGALTLLRPGAVPAEAIAAAAGRPVAMVAPGVGPGAGPGVGPGVGPAAGPGVGSSAGAAAVEAPGMHFRHYAPRLPVVLEVTERRPGMFLIGFGAIEGDWNLSPSGDLEEAAAALFDTLHRADASGAEMIGVAPIPEHGLGVAINDRLRRSQTP